MSESDDVDVMDFGSASISLLREIRDGLVAMRNAPVARKYMKGCSITVPAYGNGVDILRKQLIADIEKFLSDISNQFNK